MALSNERMRLDSKRSQAAQFFAENYSREKRYLIILSRDLKKNFEAINAMGIEESKNYQLFFDFQCDFEKLREMMAEFRWSKDLLQENGIDFREMRKLYFAVA